MMSFARLSVLLFVLSLLLLLSLRNLVTRQLIENDDGDMRSWLRLESKKHYLVWFLSWKIFHEDQLPKNELKRNQARLISPISLSDGRSAPAGPRGRRKGQRASSPRLRNSHRWRDSDTRPAAERRSNITVDCMCTRAFADTVESRVVKRERDLWRPSKAEQRSDGSTRG
jgi:hypothetical protein